MLGAGNNGQLRGVRSAVAIRLVCTTLVLLSCSAASASDAPAPQRFASLAQRAVDHQLNYAPYLGYFTGLPAPDNRRWADRSAAAVAVFERVNDELLSELRSIDPKGLPKDVITYDTLKELLEAEQQQRVCRAELWDVNHMGGWHHTMVQVAQEQPVGTADERAQAIERWNSSARMVDVEIENLRLGLSKGYSSPKSVVRRVIKQVAGLSEAALDKSPLMSPAQRSDDAAFKKAFEAAIRDKLMPALRRYHEYLETQYLPKARDELGVAANPQGRECYQAALRGYTTLSRTPQQVYDLGRATVERNAAVVAEMGQRKFGTRDIVTIAKRVKESTDNRFASEEELITFSRASVKRAHELSAPLFLVMPSQTVLVEPFRDFMRGSGASSHYESQVDATKPAYYRIATDHWSDDTRGGAEITAVHEAYPGHHMQIALSRSVEQTPVAKLSFNSAYLEGWARYSETLAEEAGMYGTEYAKISRRIWPARGMVADPGLHVLGWTPEQTIKYLADTGRFSEQEAADTVDRMAILPGQLTAYDSGGLEILALREQARTALADRFDLRQFHHVVLGQGVVPLGTLRRNVEAWIAERRTK